MLIPLHQAARWRDQLDEQLTELEGVARIIVSDASGHDETLASLRSSGNRPHIDWVGPRPLASGWVAHANDLQRRATTEFVMWLPQDDSITRDWILDAEAQLDKEHDAVAACGPIIPLSVDSIGRGAAIAVEPFATLRDPHLRVTSAIDRLLLGQSSELGIFFRSVTRRAIAPPLPRGVVDDDWSDVLWSIRLLTLGPIAAMAPSYGKRWHDHNTHGRWRDHAAEAPEEVRARLIAMLTDLEPDQQARAIASVWTSDVRHVREEGDERAEHWRALHAALWRDIQGSGSWRVTAPARALGRFVRRARTRRPGSDAAPNTMEPRR